jgi:hypothetical protein
MKGIQMIDRRTMIGIMLAAIPAAACSKAQKPAPLVQVYKSPACGCCGAWVESLRASGFKTITQDMDDVSPIAAAAGVPDNLRSCHTALVEGYFVEGHVPDGDIRKLLRERPDARGIAVPGMPVGSPGMEQGGRQEPYSTLIVARDGSVRSFVDHAI